MTMITTDGLEPEGYTVSGTHLAELRQSFRGELIDREHANYDVARRVWNGNVDRRPALVARCTGVADVQCAVNFARVHGIRVSVRGGGHSAPGYGTNDGGLVIDMAPMKGIRVDPDTRTAWAEGGVLWRELDRETQVFGLATTGGTVSNTGIAGLTLGGGLSQRKLPVKLINSRPAEPKIREFHLDRPRGMAGAVVALGEGDGADRACNDDEGRACVPRRRRKWVGKQAGVCPPRRWAKDALD